MNWKINYLYLKYRDYILNDTRKFELKRNYKLSSDDYAILCNKITDYQMNKYGDILYYTGYEFYNKEELDKISHRSAQRRKQRLKRKGGLKDEY